MISEDKQRQKAHGSIHDDKATINKTARGQSVLNTQEGTYWISHKKVSSYTSLTLSKKKIVTFLVFQKCTSIWTNAGLQLFSVHNQGWFFSESNFYFVFNRSLYQYFFKHKNLKQNKDKNTTAPCESNYQLHKNNQQNYKAIKESKAGTCQ